jgi:cytochrome b pre-mRNA-processing protein 3
MLLDRLFREKPARAAGPAHNTAVVEKARAPDLFSSCGIPDTVEGRFESYSLHVFLLLDRLRRQGPQAADTAQALFDTYVLSLDDALREMGVGDLTVGKKMRRLGEAFYGRVKSLEAAFEALPETADLDAVLSRTALEGAEVAPGPLRDYVLAERASLALLPLEPLYEGKVWGQS